MVFAIFLRKHYMALNETPTLKERTMSLKDYDYQVWRKALHDHQIKIDNFELTFWTGIAEGNSEFEERHAKFIEERKVLVEELEAIYAAEPR